MYFWLKIKKFRNFLSRGPPQAQFRELNFFIIRFLCTVEKLSFSNKFRPKWLFSTKNLNSTKLTIFEVIPNFMNKFSITSSVKKPIVIIGDDVSFPKMNLEFHTLHHRWYLYFVNNNLVFVNYPDSYPLHIKHVFSLNKIFLLPECI